MNFAEFPIAALGKRKPGAKTLTFSDTVHGENGKLFPRTLTITASDAWGLPTSADDEVILGLIQIAARDQFKSRDTYFTRYELIKLLGWSKNKVNYQRIEESLARWKGISLYYDRSWWDAREKSWVSESFALLDNVSIYDDERRRRRLQVYNDDPNAGLSSITWNKVVHNNFLAGNIKSLNFEFFTRLHTPTSKRMFRFLDKRLHKGQQLCIDIRCFACSHIGISDEHDSYNIRRKLLPAITELEQKNFLAPLPPSERFRQVARGKWEVTFARASEKKDEPIIITPSRPSVFKSSAAPKRPRRRAVDERQQSLFSVPYPVPNELPPSVVAMKNYEEPLPEQKEKNLAILRSFRERKREPQSTTLQD